MAGRKKKSSLTYLRDVTVELGRAGWRQRQGGPGWELGLLGPELSTAPQVLT